MPDRIPSGAPWLGDAVSLRGGRAAWAPRVILINPDGSNAAVGVAQGSYNLAAANTLAAGTGSQPQPIIPGGSYVWDTQFTGASIRLQSLGADGVTWRDTASLTASGTYASPLVIGVGTQVRLFNPNGTDVTIVSSNLLQGG